MSQFHLWSILVSVIVGATFVTGDDTPISCPNDPDYPTMNDEFRNFILDTYNGYRSRLAKGIHPSLNGTSNFPSGKNINKVTWDCRIEAAARQASEVCYTSSYPDFEVHGFGQIHFWNDSAYESPKKAMELLIMTQFRDWIMDFKVDEDGETRLCYPRRVFMTDKIETFACWFGSENCNAYYSYNSTNANTTAICGFSPPQLRTADSDGVLHYPATYTLGSPCSVDSDCTNPNGFTSCDAALGLCTKTPTPATTTTPPYNPCSSGWTFYLPTNSCYKYVNGSTNRSQAQAEQWCINQGKKGHLVSVHSEAENEFVKGLIPSGSDSVLIGYSNQTWTDATPFDYDNFATTCGNTICAAFSSPNFQWKSVDCNGPFKQFLCKRNV